MRPAESLWHDIRIALRVLRASLGNTALCVLSVALGIGLTTGLFSARKKSKAPPMRLGCLPRARKALEDAPAFYKQARFFARDLWQARVNDDWRFYFHIMGDTYLIRDIIRHPK
jgi:hypothetical protein